MEIFNFFTGVFQKENQNSFFYYEVEWCNRFHEVRQEINQDQVHLHLGFCKLLVVSGIVGYREHCPMLLDCVNSRLSLYERKNLIGKDYVHMDYRPIKSALLYVPNSGGWSEALRFVDTSIWKYHRKSSKSEHYFDQSALQT